ncbi:sodium:proton antiporter [Lactobacillus sp.]|uniref:sodium:proton antiporter n=1 Tax=Lactobacillus sp. TaxID=1591 RepID=UPI003EF2FB64
MNTNEVLIVLVFVVLIALLLTQFYRNYQVWLLEKLGYWNVMVLVLIVVLANVGTYIWSGMAMLAMMLPVDVILLIDAIYTYFRVRRYKNSKTKS